MDKTKHLKTKHSIAFFNLISRCDGDELRFYLYVKLYAINQNSAFPSQKSFERDLGWSKYTTSRIAKKMEDKKRLIVERNRGRNNIYDITWYDMVNDKSSRETLTTSSRETLTTSSRETLTTSSRETLTQTNRNKTNRNKTIAKQSFAINELIELFEKVNPSYKKLFANKTQRSAIERLVKEHGEEKVKWVINILEKTNREKYAPTITTPIQLEDKLGTLITFLKRSKNKKPIIAKVK